MAQNVVINGVTYSDVPEVDIPKSGGSGTAKFYDTSGANVSASDILSGKKAFGSSGAVTGLMTNNGDYTDTISTKGNICTIPAGYHSGQGYVTISAAEQAKIISSNIKNGVTILGEQGSPTVVDTSISTGGAAAADIVSGKKAYVNGSLVTGSASMPVVTQDSTTKVLTIS